MAPFYLGGIERTVLQPFIPPPRIPIIAEW